MGKARFEIELLPLARTQLNELRVYEHRLIVQRIREQLSYEPDKPTRNRKLLGTVPASFAYKPPLWELRVGEYRAFYDVDYVGSIVRVRSVRHKPPHKTIQELLE